MLHVVACPRCRRARVVEAGKRTAQCGSCGRALELEHLRAYHTTTDADEARQAVGLVNARLAKREDEYGRALLPDRAPAARHDSPHEAAAAEARKASSESDRADRIARALSALLGQFTMGDLVRAFALAGIPTTRVEDHVDRMRVANVVYEPRPGRLKAF